jgi:hypothetical protein
LSKSLTKHLKADGSGFTELHAKLDADTLLDVAIHLRRDEKRSRRSTRVIIIIMLVYSAEA